MKEIEVKARVADLPALLAAIAKLGIELSKPASQRDRVFFEKNLSPERRHTAPALRVRDQDGKIIFTFKVPDKNNLDKIEHESVVENGAEMAAICEALGFEETVRINKLRRKAVYEEYEICVDEVEGLGSYIEVEKLAAEGDSEKIQTELFDLLRSFGVSPDDRVFEGYDIMLLKKAGKMPV